MSQRPVEMTADLVQPGAAAAPPDPTRRPQVPPAPVTAPAPVAAPRPLARPVALPEVRPEPVRRTVSIKLTEGIIERLREYTHKSRHQKQDVVEVALQRFLDAEGF